MSAWAQRGIALAKILGLSLVMTAVILGWLAFREGIFDGPEALDERAKGVDSGALEGWPFVDGGVEDPSPEVPMDAPMDGGVEPAKGPSIGLGGVGRLSANRLSIEDKQKRNVLRVRNVRASINLRAMRQGAIRIPKGHLEGVEITLYRDESGKMSIANAFRGSESAKPAEEAAKEPAKEPEPSPDDESWIIGAGPVTLKDVILTLGFTDKPVQFQIDRGSVRVRRGKADSGPVIYFDDIEGALLKPQPLPRTVRIAYAKGIVRLESRPLVEMAARTCLGISELRIRAVVPARKKPVELTATSIGVSSLLGRTVLQAVAGVKSDKIDYEWGWVKLKGGKNCLQPATRNEEATEPDRRDERVP
jgi:hypothetical protein